jgi:hypothetical protein
MPKRIIKISSCKKCPYRHYDNGGGFTEPFDIILDDKMKNGEWFFVSNNGIHPECKLEIIKE